MAIEKIKKTSGIKILSVLLCALLFLLISAQSASASMLGDVNSDGVIDVRDVVLVEKHVLSVPPGLNPAQQVLADVNGDGVINVADVSLLMRYTLNLISEFPIGHLQVISVKALNAKTIGVEFNKVPSATEKVAVAVTVKSAGSIVVPTSVTWDGKVAHVTRTVDLNYATGTYTVEVAGITPVFTGTVTISLPTATTLDIKATGIPNDTAKAPLRVVLLDQYGEEMPLSLGAFNYTAFNLTLGTNVTSDIGYDSTAKFYINTKIPMWPFSPAFYVGNQVQLTFIHIASGLNKTVTIPVTIPTQLGSLTIGDPILPPGATVLFKDFTNIRLPITAKDQNGEELFLVKGGNVSVFSSNTSIISNADLDFVTGTDGKQYLNIVKFLSHGDVIITILGTPGGVVTNKTLSVVQPVPTQIEVFSMPQTTLYKGAPGESTTVRFNILDQYGNKITTDQVGYAVHIAKSSGANTILTAPAQGSSYGIVNATAGITITAGNPALPASDTITFRLQKDGTFLDGESITFNLIENLNALDFSVNKAIYTAGENIQFTVHALFGGIVHSQYNKSGLAKITLTKGLDTVFFNRTLSFVNGVATTSVPATLANANYNVTVEYGGIIETKPNLLTIEVGTPNKYVLTKATPNLGIALTDIYGNVVLTFNGDYDLKLTYPAGADPKNADAEDVDRITFGAGLGTIEFNTLVSGTYSVQGGGYSGTVTIVVP